MSLSSILVGLDLVAFAAAIAMAFQAFRAHRVIKSNRSLVFLTSFSLISLGILFRLLTDVLQDVTTINMGFVTGMPTVPLSHKLLLLMASLCILAAYTLLLLVVENVRNRSMWVLVFVLVAFTVFLATDVFLVTHILAVVLLGLLSYRFWKNFLKRNSTNALLVYLGFFSLMASHVAALLIPFGQLPHLIFLSLRLLGFFLLFAMAWRVTRG